MIQVSRTVYVPVLSSTDCRGPGLDIVNDEALAFLLQEGLGNI
jgi:hypothetical protein